MKKYISGLIILLFIVSCQSENSTTTTDSTDSTATNSTTVAKSEPVGEPVTIKGTVNGLKEGQKVYFDKKTIDATGVVGRSAVSPEGKFEINANITEPGIYRMRLGVKSVYMLLKGGETVELTAEVEGYNIKDYTISGSLHSEEMKKWADAKKSKKIAEYINNMEESKPLLQLYLVEKLDIFQYIDTYKKVRDALVATYPNTIYVRKFNSKVLTTETKIKSKPVALGKPAPEINLPNPDGKKIALSSLKGKVVLIDFWASWCRPCRAANPHVVEIYKKYKDQGFDVYSVSFDGIDDRMLKRFKGNQPALEAAMKKQKQAWMKAIKDDKLTWPHHVSELRSWSSQIGKVYGVNSIPRTFLLDREGIVRYDNIRPQQLEPAVKELLAEE